MKSFYEGIFWLYQSCCWNTFSPSYESHDQQPEVITGEKDEEEDRK